MEFIKKTYDDLTDEEVNDFINYYPYKTDEEIEILTDLGKNEITKLKKHIYDERGITLIKNKNYIKEDFNPPATSGGITMMQKVLEVMPPEERNEMMNFAKNKPDNLALMSELIIHLRHRVQTGIAYEYLEERGLNPFTENAISNYMNAIRIADEMENGIKMNHDVKHDIFTMIKDVKQEVDEEKEIIIEPE